MPFFDPRAFRLKEGPKNVFYDTLYSFSSQGLGIDLKPLSLLCGPYVHLSVFLNNKVTVNS